NKSNHNENNNTHSPTSYQQTHLLLTACLAKGERACCRFYQALGSEDPQLASDIKGMHVAEATAGS
uniref:CARD domain-containing protein n=1 Tax=Esox lucius TaxID=8010 RepID=A0A6Q2YYW4_ESOLU